MAVIIKGSNYGLAVDGDVKIENLDLVFGEGVKSASGVSTVRADAEKVVYEEVGKEDVEQDAQMEYPELTSDVLRFFQKKVRSVNGVTGLREEELPIETLMHRIYDVMKAYNPEDGGNSEKWWILFKLLNDRRYFLYETRPPYAGFIKVVVRYCFPNVQDSYASALSKAKIDGNKDSWYDSDARNFYTMLYKTLNITALQAG